MVNYKIGDALKEGIASLNESKIESSVTDARVLLCHVLSCDSLYLTVYKDNAMKEEDAKKYFEFINRRKKCEPVSYITGKKEFMSLDFCVDSGVLIPRPDTEVLCTLAIEKLKDMESVNIIDMCTGSGAVAVALKKYIPQSTVTALDISDDAIRVANRNAKLNGVDIEVKKHDVKIPYTALADAVVSNPPYIPTRVVGTLDTDVADFEPHLALDGGADGLDFYKAIVKNIRQSLKAGGLVAFEVGHDQWESVADIMKEDFTDIGYREDIAGIKRVVYGTLK